MKRFELAFTFLQLPLDYLLLILAGVSAYALRFSDFIIAIRPIYFNVHLPWERYVQIVLLVALGWLLIFAFSGLYSTNPNRKLARELARVFLACSTGFAAITIFVFFTLQKFDSRFLVLAGWIFAIVYVSAGRIALRLLKMFLYRIGIGLRRTVLLGDDAIAETIRQTLGRSPALGYELVGVVPHLDKASAKKILSWRADELIVTNPRQSEAETLELVEFAAEHHITFKYSADLFATIATRLAVSTIAGIPIIELTRTGLTAWGRIIKRLLDITGGLILGLLALPWILLISLLILLETGWPIFYRNRRVGQEGREFFVFKFRSMYQKDCTGEQFGPAGTTALKKERELIKTNSIKAGPIYKIANDPRITPLGAVLRRWSLDELPQFINVLWGEMSLVGPRPHQPREVAGYQTRHKIVLAIKPGITGLAQISGRSNLSFEEEVRLDTFYVEHWNVLLDIVILIKTPWAVLKKDGAVI